MPLALTVIRKKKFCVLQKKVLSFGPNRTVEVRPNSSAEPNVRSITRSQWHLAIHTYFGTYVIKRGVYCTRLIISICFLTVVDSRKFQPGSKYLPEKKFNHFGLIRTKKCVFDKFGLK